MSGRAMPLLPAPSAHASLDPRAWLLWGAAASLPPLVGRNPFVLLATLLAALGVHAAWRDAPGHRGWRGITRVALVFALVGSLFNVLTVHAGDRPFAQLPTSWPIVGGPLTVNALVYGLLGAAATVTLVLVGTTLGRVLDWATVLRLLPPRLSTVAVAGSVAWAFVPQTAVALGEIREAQSARGHRPRGVRDVVPLLVPLLAGGLERAITLAEALEARAFGAPLDPATDAARPWRGIATVLGLSALAVAGFLLAVGRPAAAVASLTVALLGLTAAGRQPGGAHRPRRTRYREPAWGRRETTIAAAAGLALAVEIGALLVAPGAFAYEPYPSLTAPRVALPLLAALGLLLAPVAVAP